MCSHYDPVIRPEKLKQHFGVSDPLPNSLKESVWPGYIGPFVRKHEFSDVGDDAVPSRELLVGSFGLVPSWADPKSAANTYNARSETVDSKNTFKAAWRKAQHCIIPAESIWEPDWRTKKCVPTRLVRADGKPMGIAGIWESKLTSAGIFFSFTMLTINADAHPFMKEYHQPNKEKRMVVILQEDDYGPWLSASLEESPGFIRQFPAEMMAVAADQTPLKSLAQKKQADLF